MEESKATVKKESQTSTFDVFFLEMTTRDQWIKEHNSALSGS